MYYQNKDKVGLKQLGGSAGLAKALHSDTVEGINPNGHASISDRHAEFGANRFKELPQKSFWSMVFEALQDPTLLLLMAAALVRWQKPVIVAVYTFCTPGTSARARQPLAFSKHSVCVIYIWHVTCLVYARTLPTCRFPPCLVLLSKRKGNRMHGQRELQSGLLSLLSVL